MVRRPAAAVDSEFVLCRSLTESAQADHRAVIAPRASSEGSIVADFGARERQRANAAGLWFREWTAAVKVVCQTAESVGVRNRHRTFSPRDILETLRATSRGGFVLSSNYGTVMHMSGLWFPER